VIEAFLAAMLRARLGVAPQIDPGGFPVFEADRAEDALCMAVHAGGDLWSLLRLWDTERGRAATLHIANIVGKADWHRLRLANNCWYGFSLRPDVEAAMRAVLSWLLTPEMRDRLEDACLAEPDAAAAGLLSYAESPVMSAIRRGVDDQLRITSP